jgi:hypothetical protein
MPRVAPCLLHLVASALLALILSLGMAGAAPFGGCGTDSAAPAAPHGPCACRRGL